MTPNAIEILIHCHSCPMPHPRRGAHAVEEELRSLQENELIEPDPSVPNGYRTTDRGRAHIEQLCSTAWPVQVWVDSNGKPIDIDFLK